MGIYIGWGCIYLFIYIYIFPIPYWLFPFSLLAISGVLLLWQAWAGHSGSCLMSSEATSIKSTCRWTPAQLNFTQQLFTPRGGTTREYAWQYNYPYRALFNTFYWSWYLFHRYMAFFLKLDVLYYILNDVIYRFFILVATRVGHFRSM